MSHRPSDPEGTIPASHQGGMTASHEGGMTASHEGGMTASHQGGMTASQEGGMTASQEGGMTPPLQAMLARAPGLAPAAADLLAAFRAIADVLQRGGCLYLCGNGGSMADALHISAELLKSFALPRPLDADLRQRLAAAGPDGALLGEALQQGLRATVLGLNHSLDSALGNDIDCPGIGYAQELLALAHPGDALLGISTSGNARNVCYAAQVARARGLVVVALTGEGGGRLATLADIAIRAPSTRTERVQEQHVSLYHCLCEMLEVHFFGR